jgi:hypothetical protein
VLADFDALRSKFVKVFPTDFKRVLAERAGTTAASAGAGAPATVSIGG